VAGFYSATRDRVMPPLLGLLLLRRAQLEAELAHTRSTLAHAPIGSALTHDNRSLYPGARTVDDGKMIEQRPKARFFLDNSKGVDALDQSTTSESRKMQSLTAVNLSSKPWWDFARIDTLR
jgi:hypothetical protein